jgi:hypothetical protein
MKILANGINYTTGEPLAEPLGELAFADCVSQSLGKNGEEVRALAQATASGAASRGEFQRQPTADQGDPRAAGWTFLVNANDPQKDALIVALRPLAEQRGMPHPDRPLLYHGESSDGWFDWMTDNFSPLVLEKVPLYVLIAGGPDQVPFAFQSMLGSAAAVGRVSFETLDELNTYVEKILRLEGAPAPIPQRSALFFAPDYGYYDATHYSCEFLAKPLADHLHDQSGVPTQSLFAAQATLPALDQALCAASPALVFSASHGLAAPGEDPTVQRRLNGAICCHRRPGQPRAEWLYSADDIPMTEPFLEGSVFFQFACYGYGTPAESDFAHWLGNPALNTTSDFIAALPRRLLAHPHGPLAYIGHVDTAFLHGITDPADVYLTDRWSPRIAPFQQAVDQLMNARPPGLAISDLHARANICNAQLTATYDRIQRGSYPQADNFKVRLANLFITRSDAQNYMILGDPAVQLRMRA